MSDPTNDAFAAQSERRAILARAELPEVTFFLRALQVAEELGLGVARANVQRVERFWSMESGDWNALGFVLELRDGRRVSLDYFFDFDINRETVEAEPMGAELHPVVDGAEIDWRDDTWELNRLLMS